MNRPNRHRATSRFWKGFAKLPSDVQATARASFETLKADPNHPALRFKKAGNVWSARVGLHFRAIAEEDEDGYVWLWIGTHSEYDKLLGRHRKS